MALTNFAALTTEQLTMWSRDTWRAARNMQFLNQFTGTGPDSMIQRVTELTKTKKGARAVMTLVQDLTGDGVAGDRTLEGNEEALQSDDIVIQIDQLRHANRHKGKMADQRSVVEFRNNSRNNLAYWLADRMDQMAFLTLAGVAYTFTNRGATRTGSDLPNLDFAADVVAPSTNRHYRWDATNGLEAGATNAVEITDLPSWAMLVEMKALAEESYIKPIRGEGGTAFWHIFMTPSAVAQLKQDPDFLANIRNAAPRSDSNVLFKGANTIMVDGMAIHSYRHVFNNRDAGSGNYWGASSNVEGCRVLMCGQQAMGFADIGDAEWVEKGFDYENQQGIAYGKMMGFLKPKFQSIYSGTEEDFGVLCVDVAQKPVARS